MPKSKVKTQLQHSEGLTLVDFYADWCGPCRTMDPIIREVLSELGEKISLLKLNVDQNPQLGVQFGVRSIPHYILMKKGKVLWRKGGVMTKRDLLKSLKAFLG